MVFLLFSLSISPSQKIGYWSQLPLLIISVLSSHMHTIPILLSFPWLALPVLTLHSFIHILLFGTYWLKIRCSAGTILGTEDAAVNKIDGIFSWSLHYGCITQTKTSKQTRYRHTMGILKVWFQSTMINEYLRVSQMNFLVSTIV